MDRERRRSPGDGAANLNGRRIRDTPEQIEADLEHAARGTPAPQRSRNSRRSRRTGRRCQYGFCTQGRADTYGSTYRATAVDRVNLRRRAVAAPLGPVFVQLLSFVVCDAACHDG